MWCTQPTAIQTTPLSWRRFPSRLPLPQHLSLKRVKSGMMWNFIIERHYPPPPDK